MFSSATGKSRRKQTIARSKLFAGSRRGLIRNDSLAVPQGEGAEVLDNFFPTTQGIKMRGGLTRHATINAPVDFIATYDSGLNEQMFAASTENIYNVTAPADPDVVPTPDVTGQSSGDYSAVNFVTDGGQYLIMVNGSDFMQRYDGADWEVVNEASDPPLTGISSALLSAVWKFKSRLFAIEIGSLSFWYLPVNSIAGEMVEFPLGGVVQSGGVLLFGATWSLDSGAGLDDVCVFMTSKGELVVYQGSDPSMSDDWALVGVYRIGEPLGKNANFRSGGDISIATDDGIVPVSAAVKFDQAALSGQSITLNIEDLWNEAVVTRKGIGNFITKLWHSRTLLMVGIPTGPGDPSYCLVANTRTGAWARYTNWDVRSAEVFRDQLYIGSGNARIYAAETQGIDDDLTYTCTWVPRFDDMGLVEEKQAVMSRVTALESTPVAYQQFASANWQPVIPTPGSPDPDVATNVWGTAIWGVFIWGATAQRSVQTQWNGVSAHGQSLAPGVQIITGRLTPPDVVVVSLNMVYHVGRIAG